MKKTARILSLIMALVMMVSVFAACGEKEEEKETRMTKEEYADAFQKLSDDLTEVQTEAQKLDANDVEGAKKILEDLKAPFTEFIDTVNPPEEYEEAHGKIKSGCEHMVAYIDIVLGAVGETDQDKLNEAASDMMEELQAAVADLSEGATMLEEADK